MTSPTRYGVQVMADERGRLPLWLDFDGPGAVDRALAATHHFVSQGISCVRLIRHDESAAVLTGGVTDEKMAHAVATRLGADLTHIRLAFERQTMTIRYSRESCDVRDECDYFKIGPASPHPQDLPAVIGLRTFLSSHSAQAPLFPYGVTLASWSGKSRDELDTPTRHQPVWAVPRPEA